MEPYLHTPVFLLVTMALTSSSTLANALAQYNDNLSWEGSPSKAALALEAIRWLLVNREQSSSIRGRSINYASLESQEAKVSAYVSAVGTTSAANKCMFTRGKMLR
jgi:hypothetical protein